MEVEGRVGKYLDQNSDLKQKKSGMLFQKLVNYYLSGLQHSKILTALNNRRAQRV